MRTLELDGVQLLFLDLNIAALRELVTSPLMVFVHDASRLFVHHLLLQPMSRLRVDLVEMRLLSLRRSRIKRDGTSNQRKLQ